MQTLSRRIAAALKSRQAASVQYSTSTPLERVTTYCSLTTPGTRSSASTTLCLPPASSTTLKTQRKRRLRGGARNNWKATLVGLIFYDSLPDNGAAPGYFLLYTTLEDVNMYNDSCNDMLQLLTDGPPGRPVIWIRESGTCHDILFFASLERQGAPKMLIRPGIHCVRMRISADRAPAE